MRGPVLPFFTDGDGGRPGDTDIPLVSALDVGSFALWGALEGVVPRIAIVSGRCFAGNAVLAGCTDLRIATPDANLGMAGPANRGGALGEVSAEEIGPVDDQAAHGVLDIVVEDESEAVEVARQLLGQLSGATTSGEAVDQSVRRTLLPDNDREAFAVRPVVEDLADLDSVTWLRESWAPELVTVAAEVSHELRDAVVAALGSGAARPGVSDFGVVVLEHGEVVETSPGLDLVLAELAHHSPDEYLHLEHLRALAAGPLPFSTVIRTPGGWLTAHGSRLGSDKVAVSLTAAGPDRLLGARIAAARLSARELEVTHLLCRGLSDREISRELGVSEHTAHDHVRAVRRKLGVRSRAEVSATIFAEQYFEGFLASAVVAHG